MDGSAVSSCEKAESKQHIEIGGGGGLARGRKKEQPMV